jgi:hypothetical protein
MKHVRTAALLVAAIVTGGIEPAAAQNQPQLSGTGNLVLILDSAARDTPARIRDAVSSLGGQLVHAGETQLSIDIPRSSYARLVRRLAELGRVRSERIVTEDLTDQMADAEAAARAARDSHQRLQRANVTARDMNERVALERELEQIERKAADAEARLRELRRRAATTRVEIRLSAPQREAPIEAPALPFPWLHELRLPRLLDTTSSPESDGPRYELRALLDGAFELRVAHAPEPEPLDDTSTFAAVALSFRTLGQSSPIGLFGGFDLLLGGGGGFWYGAQSLIGLGVPLGSRFAIGLSSGPGIDGVTGGVVPFGVPVPIELFVMLDVASFLKASLWLRDGWVLASEERAQGSELAPFGDELSAGVTFGFGQRDDSGYSRERFGPTLGVAYRELMGTALWELRVGWGASALDMTSAY